MLNKLVHGFLFGLGFSLAVVLVSWTFSSYYFSSSDETKLTLNEKEGLSYEEKAQWREVPISKRIPQLTGAVLLRFKEGEDKLMSAYVESILTKNSTIKMPLKIGDRVQESDYYAQDFPSNNRGGVLIMYVNNPPEEIEGTYLYDDRLIAYGNMPLELFFKKFKASN